MCSRWPRARRCRFRSARSTNAPCTWRYAVRLVQRPRLVARWRAGGRLVGRSTRAACLPTARRCCIHARTTNAAKRRRGVVSVFLMIYQHPLAYLLGLEGVALLRAWAGDYDKEFVLTRLAEVRRLIDDET